MEKLAAAEEKFAQELPPVEALRAWLLLFVDYIAAKHLIAPALNALLGDPKKVFEASYARIWDAIRALVKRAVKSGDIRKDLDPVDLLRALIGVANVATSPDWQQSARRLVNRSARTQSHQHDHSRLVNFALWAGWRVKTPTRRRPLSENVSNP
jgi:integrase